jgi:hypothetical protein
MKSVICMSWAGSRGAARASPLAVAHIAAVRLAEHRLGFRHVEDVIDDLEEDAQFACVVCESFDCRTLKATIDQ